MSAQFPIESEVDQCLTKKLASIERRKLGLESPMANVMQGSQAIAAKVVAVTDTTLPTIATSQATSATLLVGVLPRKRGHFKVGSP